MESLELLIARLNRLPGVGIKSAQRLAFHIIAMPEEDVSALTEAITCAKQKVHFCPVCGN